MPQSEIQCLHPSCLYNSVLYVQPPNVYRYPTPYGHLILMFTKEDKTFVWCSLLEANTGARRRRLQQYVLLTFKYTSISSILN